MPKKRLLSPKKGISFRSLLIPSETKVWTQAGHGASSEGQYTPPLLNQHGQQVLEFMAFTRKCPSTRSLLFKCEGRSFKHSLDLNCHATQGRSTRAAKPHRASLVKNILNYTQKQMGSQCNLWSTGVSRLHRRSI
ncbi:hypothetical protein KIL84_012923 [Mauremys mutica]|uniref:Uncharacterized protein n=1 Tax=Mauremys mutica TaxID=74926 RepID=A0A9D3XSG0_9SAUR|nr:hypothetical protein KIL84_012923 [Mauremys mutica]